MRLYDTLTRSLQPLPGPPGPIGMYFCGPTVYQRIHVGNAVPFVLSMWLKRWLERAGYETTLVINITDINDKIYDAAPGESAGLAERATRWYLDDTSRLGLGRPDAEPTAAQTVTEQIRMIEELIGDGFAYESDGDVYFRVARFPDYGRLSRQKLDEVREQEPNPRKEDQRDFAHIWMHNGMLSFRGEEMHKSAGNAVELRAVLDRFGHETVLLFFMTGHWRKPLDFSNESMTAAAAQAETLRNALRGETRASGDWDSFSEVLEDDFNTPAALAILHEWARTGALEELGRGLDVFGLGGLADRAQAPPEVVTLAEARIGARASRDFAEADRLRDEIAEHGWEVRDVASGYELVPRA